jgi:hypothetical protein
MNRFSFPPRSAQTTIPCKQCQKPLVARRTCHEAYLYCEHCARESPVSAYSAQMDDALEQFIESLNCDRA